jgi:fatty acid desaturase
MVASVEDRITRISSTIKAEETRLREKYAFLQYQNTIGLIILLVSLGGMICTAVLYYFDSIPVWTCIVSAAVFASISHELEHDLIHRQYFKENKLIHNLMMLAVWVMRPNTVNPWYRRGMHFLHHKVSGTPSDLEERLVGNGIAYGFLRFLVMFDGLLGVIARRTILNKEVESFSLHKILSAAFPLATFYFTTWYVFLSFHTVDWLWGTSITYPEWLFGLMGVVNFLVVTLIAPNFIRSACLNFVTSTMHYYGNVENPLQQTQVLKSWFFAPLQLFCFNFGSTHGIHHFVVGQPFYLRQMVAKAAHKVMRDNGVRFNDFHTFASANQYIPIVD